VTTGKDGKEGRQDERKVFCLHKSYSPSCQQQDEDCNKCRLISLKATLLPESLMHLKHLIYTQIYRFLSVSLRLK
jgi:hypothetical protein